MSDEMSNLLEKPLFAPKTIITMPSAIPKPRTLYDKIWDDHVVWAALFDWQPSRGLIL